VRLFVPGRTLRRAITAVVATALLLPVAAAGAARDPLSQAEARVTSARRAANEAAQAYDDAQNDYYGLQNDIAVTRENVKSTEASAQALTAAAQARAVEAYQGSTNKLELVMNGDDVRVAMRRNELLDRVNEDGNDAVDQLSVMTEELHAQEATLNDQLKTQEQKLAEMKARETQLRSALAAAQKAEADLKARLERERRAKELAARLQRARAAADRSRSGDTGGANRGGGVIVSGAWPCPVQGGVSFTDTWGAPRSGGRRHQGVDMMAAGGTPVVAVESGSIQTRTGGLGGNAIWLNGSSGNTYYYAHLRDFAGGSRGVSSGEVIGWVGNTGNARGGPTHLHFEIHPGGGHAVDPYPTTRAHC
jgi:murein DD-endopeptidase MepM/ murein hydrolase activator NlpD